MFIVSNPSKDLDLHPAPRSLICNGVLLYLYSTNLPCIRNNPPASASQVLGTLLIFFLLSLY